MSDESDLVSRRDFLSRALAGTLVGATGLWIQAAIPRPLAAAEATRAVEDAAPLSLDARQWQVVEAITARILPTDDTPGALEAGCVHFIDRALAYEDAAALPAYRVALAELDRLCREQAGMGFVELPEEGQDEMLARLETGSVVGWREESARPQAFFATVRMHTILGFVLDPRYGGNRDHVGWKTMGFPGPVHHLGGSQPDHMNGKLRFVPAWERTRHPAHADPDPE